MKKYVILSIFIMFFGLGLLSTPETSEADFSLSIGFGIGGGYGYGGYDPYYDMGYGGYNITHNMDTTIHTMVIMDTTITDIINILTMDTILMPLHMITGITTILI